MKQVRIQKIRQEVPAVIVGCMRQAGFTDKPFTPQEMNHFIHTALENGANYFDHADIYGLGRAERVFGEAMELSGSSIQREDLILQSKCGIRQGCYDSSKEHILSAADGILERLKTDYLDVLLLHRPDALIEPEEVAEAFDKLYTSGKVRYFGVSNYTPGQIALLQKYLKQELVVNQMECSIVHAGMISSGIEANMTSAGSVDHDGGILDFCRLNEITLQTWSPFQISLHDGSFIDNPKYPELNKKLGELSEKYGTTKAGIAEAWILRHPAGMQVVVGTSREERLVELIKASGIVLSREEWYDLYLAAGHILP
jgi:predicted oxidoreductase